MSMKYGSNSEAVVFDIEKTLGKMFFIEVTPVMVWEQTVNEETGEIYDRPTDEVAEYDILVNSEAAGGRETITVPAEAKGVELDLEKLFRKEVRFDNLTATFWESRERYTDQNGRRQTRTTTGVKLRATDFSLVGTPNLQTKEQQPKEQQKK